MAQGMVFRIGSFDLTKYGDDERWAKMNQLARFYAALAADFRMLAYSRPYPLVEPLERIKEMMAAAQGPRLREQIASYRRFLEQIIQSAYLKDTDYYMVLFDKDKSSQVLANDLASGLRLPVQPVPGLPSLISCNYDEAPTHIHPIRSAYQRNGHPSAGLPSAALGTGRTGPHISLLYSYDLRGQLTFNTLINFLQLPCPLSLSIDVKTFDPDKAVPTLQRAYNKLKADLLGRSGNEAPDPEKERAYLDVQVALSAVQHERQGLHQMIIAIAVEGRNRDELEQHVQMVTSIAARNQIYLRLARMHQLEAMSFFTPRPISETIAQASRNLTSTGVALCSPFGFETNKDTRGPFVAINRGVSAPLWLDKFSLPAYNEIVLGRTGSGKTFMAGLRAYRERMFGVQTIFVDPQGSFRKVTEAAEGKYNLLRLGEGTALNILDVVHESAAAQISHVIVLLEALLGRPLTIREKGTVDQALYDLYGRCQVRTDRFEPEKMPRLEDLAEALQDEENDYLPAPQLADDLDRFVNGSLQSIFNAHTTLSLDLDRRYPLITFDVSDLEGEFQPIFIFTLLSSIERVIRQRRAQQLKTNVVVDEFGILSQIPALAEATGMLAKRVRAWKVGIHCLDQNWDTFDTPAGRRILENSLVKVVMRVDETAAPAIVGNLGLTGHHAEVILSAGIGEGVMIIGSKPYHVFFQASRSEIEMLTPYGQRPGAHLVALPTRQ